MYDSDNDIIALTASCEENRKKNVITPKPVYFYELGDVINNGVKYFGQDKTLENGHRTSMCICPNCDKLWRVDLTSIRNGATKGCGCMKGKG